MSKILNIFFLLFVVGMGFVFRERLGNVYSQAITGYFPCRFPISYSIGDFDDRFGLSEEEFLSTIASAEKMWEDAIDRDLFKHKEDGRLKINLVYDARQESTVQLQNISGLVQSNQSAYEDLKSKYEAIVREYNREKLVLEQRVSIFESRQNAYEKEVISWNKKGGASGSVYEKLNAEKDYLSREYQAIKQEEANLNTTVKEINNLASSLNQLVKTLNLGVDKYNSIGEILDGEFDEGIYRSGPDGQEIDIYQFENKTKLIRVLAHELGHALGLDHIDDPKAIMYRLNNGYNESLTKSDIVILNNLCGIPN